MKSKAFSVFLFVTLLFSACGKVSDRDPSLTPEEYNDIGMPDPSKIWSHEDYMEACDILDYLKTFKPLSLPKKDSKRSSKYFNRMINPDNLSFLLDETIPLSERAYQIQKYIEIQRLLIFIYTNLGSIEQYYNRELIDLYIFGLTIAQNMLDLGERINESIEEEDLKMQNRFHSIQNLYLSMVLFVLENQKKTFLFEEADLEKLTDFLYSSVSVNNGWIETDAAEDIKLRLQEIIDNTSSEHIKNKYSMLIEVL
jgi:hypothetical protein